MSQFSSGGKVLELQLQHHPSNVYSRLISFRINWFDLLVVQLTLKSLLQHHSSKSINSLSLSLLYSPTLTSVHDYWKNHSFFIQTFVGKVMSLLFNTLSRFVIVFLPRSKHLAVSCLQSPSTVVLEPRKRKSVTTFPFSSFICQEVMGPQEELTIGTHL